MDNNERLSSLRNYARSLDFTDAQFDEAVKRINPPGTANELLAALIDVSNQDGSTSSPAKPLSQAPSTPEATALAENSSNQVQAATFGDGCQLDLVNQHSQPQVISSLGRLNIGETSSSSTSLSTPSCYSSITNFPSSCDQSLESLDQSQHQAAVAGEMTIAAVKPVAQPALRKIYIDGSNVAKTHGRDVAFSWLGIKLCVDWFVGRDHKCVKAFVPEDKCKGNTKQDETVIDYLDKIEALIKTPTGCNDDLFIIEAAKLNNGVIVSNDQYRDEKRFNDDLDRLIKFNRLPYIFVDDLFIPANDPLGRTGPTLGEFLMEPTNGGLAQNAKLCRSKSHQKYQKVGHFQPKQNQMFPGNNGHRSLHSTKSLPVDSMGNNLMQYRWCQASARRQAPTLHHNSHSTKSIIRDRQKVRQSISCFSNPITETKDEQQSELPQVVLTNSNKRTALCRTKSHII